MTTSEEGVDGLDEFEWVCDRLKLNPGLVLVSEATENVGLIRCCTLVNLLLLRWVGWCDSAGLRLVITPRKAGLEGCKPKLAVWDLDKAGLDILPISYRAGLETECTPFR